MIFLSVVVTPFHSCAFTVVDRKFAENPFIDDGKDTGTGL